MLRNSQNSVFFSVVPSKKFPTPLFPFMSVFLTMDVADPS